MSFLFASIHLIKFSFKFWGHFEYSSLSLIMNNFHNTRSLGLGSIHICSKSSDMWDSVNPPKDIESSFFRTGRLSTNFVTLLLQNSKTFYNMVRRILKPNCTIYSKNTVFCPTHINFISNSSSSVQWICLEEFESINHSIYTDAYILKQIKRKKTNIFHNAYELFPLS